VATAANTVKVIQWLDTVCNTDVDSLLSRYASNNNDSTSTNNSINPTTEVQSMVKTLLVLLSHREETTREQTIALLTTLFTWDVLGTLFQTGLNGLLLLSRKLSAEGVRKTANSGEGKVDFIFFPCCEWLPKMFRNCLLYIRSIVSFVILAPFPL